MLLYFFIYQNRIKLIMIYINYRMRKIIYNHKFNPFSVLSFSANYTQARQYIYGVSAVNLLRAQLWSHSTIKPDLVSCHKLETYIKCPKTISNLTQKGISQLFPVQANSYHDIYNGQDIIASDRTGSGKTMAFTLPIVQRMRKNGVFAKKKNRNAKFMIMAPTRELALQITAEINKFNHHFDQIKVATLIGGADSRSQRMQLRGGAQIIVATPGRLMDFYNRGQASFSQIQVVCIDQADLMLQKGFKTDIQFILDRVHSQTSKKPQHLLFSATMPKWVVQITQKYMDPAKKFLNLVGDQGTKASKTVNHICVQVQPHSKVKVIKALIKEYSPEGSVLIFSRTKNQADFLSQDLPLKNWVLHGDIAQTIRTKRLSDFRAGKTKILVATDVAARGLDIKNVELVIQLNPPQNIDSYIHRSGRTGRAGKNGTCITLINPFIKTQKQKMLQIKQSSKIDLSVMKLESDLQAKSVILQETDQEQYFKFSKKPPGRQKNTTRKSQVDFDPETLRIQLLTINDQIDYVSLKKSIRQKVGSAPIRINKAISKYGRTLLFLRFESAEICEKLINQSIQVLEFGAHGEKSQQAIFKRVLVFPKNKK